jgi:hypothetical protein
MVIIAMKTANGLIGMSRLIIKEIISLLVLIKLKYLLMN